MSFNRYFEASSYAMVACGALALFFSGGVGYAIAIVFAGALICAWKIENTKWQLSERTSFIIVLLSLPLFYIDWKYQLGGGASQEDWVGVGALSHLILFLSIVKLVQVKVDRDWLFLYLISFFEVLLAAALSISPIFLGSLCFYAFFAFSTIICFEVRKARRAAVEPKINTLIVPERTWVGSFFKLRAAKSRGEARHLPSAALCLLILILILSIPIFLIAPRFTGGAFARSSSTSLDGSIGFSDKVTLGSFGRLQMNDRVVMRARLERPSMAANQVLRWRGVALDEFNGTQWRRSPYATENVPLDRGFFKLDSTESLDRLTTQTIFLEAIDTPNLFVASSPIALQGALPFVRKDREGALSTREHPLERISYKAYSDTIEPDAAQLRADRGAYTDEEKSRYTQFPDSVSDEVRTLASEIAAAVGAGNRYDEALAIESYLRQNFEYSLERRAGGSDPVADFLFNVRAGHCEYFATAMALMLRARGTATRVVNGFQMGDYNDAADVYTVRQLHAHSWVEVYFPGAKRWVTFDPTPASNLFSSANRGGIAGSIKKYAEALELLWIQYVVAYDRQEQRSLASTLRNKIGSYQQATFENADGLRTSLLDWWKKSRRAFDSVGGYGSGALIIVITIAALVTLALLFFLARKAGLFRLSRRSRMVDERQAPVIEFYERLIKTLEARGFHRNPDQTPLEFASGVGLPEVMAITNSYNGVRFGAQPLSAREKSEIERFLRDLETSRANGV